MDRELKALIKPADIRRDGLLKMSALKRIEKARAKPKPKKEMNNG